MSPAANAPTIGARPATPARWDSRKQNARETPIRTPDPRSRDARKRAGVIHVPMRSEPARNPTAFKVISTCGQTPEEVVPLRRRDDGAGDGGEDDQPEDVVDDRGPEDDPRLLAAGISRCPGGRAP